MKIDKKTKRRMEQARRDREKQAEAAKRLTFRRQVIQSIKETEDAQDH